MSKKSIARIVLHTMSIVASTLSIAMIIAKEGQPASNLEIKSGRRKTTMGI